MPEYHDPKKFKVGDRVKVVRKVPTDTGGWCNSWNADMSLLLGKEVTVRMCGRLTGYYLDGCNYGFPSHALELVESAEPEAQPMDGPNTHDREIFTAALELVREEVERRAGDPENHASVESELTSLNQWITEQVEDES